MGLDPQARSVETDERMRAGERLWAVGDITGQGAFTQVSMYQGAVVVRDILGEDGPWADFRAVSRVTFTDPEVGSVATLRTMHFAYPTFHRAIESALDDLPRAVAGV